jgi:dTDP-glucose pyrophosphorylase
MQIVLLAAGLGTRLSPITNLIPKQMIPICGKPLIGYIIEQLISAHFKKFCIVLGKNGHLIKNYLKDGKQYGVDIQYVYQKNEKGTADAILSAKDFIKNDPFFLYLSDTIINDNLTKIVKQMASTEHPIILLSSKISLENSKYTGNLTILKNEVTKILEKPKFENTAFAWAGVGYFKDNTIFDYIKNLNKSHTTEYEITMAMEEALLDKKYIENFLCEQFIDYGIVSGLLKASKYIFDNHKFQNHENTSNSTNSLSYIGNNCKLPNNIQIDPYTSIGDNVVIGDDVFISNSIILDNVNIPNKQHIVNSIVSENGIISL